MGRDHGNNRLLRRLPLQKERNRYIIIPDTHCNDFMIYVINRCGCIVLGTHFKSSNLVLTITYILIYIFKIVFRAYL